MIIILNVFSTSRLIMVVAYSSLSDMDSTSHDHKEFLHIVYLKPKTL